MEGNASAELLKDSSTIIRGMENLSDEEDSSLLDLQLVHHQSTAKHLSSVVSEWGKKSMVTAITENTDVSVRQTTELDSGSRLDESSLLPAAGELKALEVSSEEETPPSRLENRKSQIPTSDDRTSSVRFSRRSTIHYNPTSRIDIPDEDLCRFFDLKCQTVVLDDYPETVEEESAVCTVEEEVSILDRGLYYEKYDEISQQLVTNRIKNNVLQKLVAMYLKRRKIDYGRKEIKPPVDEVVKYRQKLDAYQQLMEIEDSERLGVEEEIFKLLNKRNMKLLELEELFKNLQNREENVGQGLIYAKTGNRMSEKTVHKSLKRQALSFEQLCLMRLKSITLQEMVQEKITAIDQINIIGDNLYLSEFEKLKAENRSLAHKIEEKDEELAVLRSKCRCTTQTLAHMREKTAALNSDVCDLNDDLNTANSEMKNCRARLGAFKQAKGSYRKLTRKIKEESSLLTQPDLLRDMEQTQKEVADAEAELIKCKHDTKKRENCVKKIKHNIQILIEEKSYLGLKNDQKETKTINKKSDFILLPSSKPTAKVYNQRPTLYIPTIKPNAFDHVVRIRPIPVVHDKRK